MKLSTLALVIGGTILLVACGKDKPTEGVQKGTDAAATVAEPKHPECIAPAKPGGGFDLTCKLIQSGLQDTNLLSKPMRVTYMPGGVGAVAYNKIVSNDRANGDAIIAFSTGSLLNLSQGKFGKFTEKDVKWLAAIGADYGAVSVSADSPYQNLTDLVEALKADPKKVTFAAGGSVGGQDWLQTALLAKQAGVNPINMSYVAMEGGGEAVTALLGHHIQVVSSGLAEVMPQVTSGKIRVLAVFAPERLEGAAKDIPTAKEQGFDIQWPVIRGYYMGPDVSEESYAWWKLNIDKMLDDPKFAEIRANRELFPFAMTGDELTQYIYKEKERLAQLSAEMNLIDQATTK
ncbi:tripartite tricarboxylate transporter substrate binding protein [Moraxella sp. Tifton1]|uniref:Bug family tripartite tricarboxylate transporter substrate binding protein n=1 Tax=Moraxella oculi TaxID=2940516 RepID=A0ABW8U355_9GAMM|nr:tripartite tricarboxylate transporter substrate binding protein [Moraxella sp. Tifton1]MCL1623114.1 tripartite tricarboxylate transporter substrate binding protein [Moraxella sp. Tifton1]